jgi:hypothetical protein
VIKAYEYIEEFIPGSTSGNGEIEAEVVYVGYGITAPELGYDDYEGIDVKGKIILIDREVPVGTDHEDFLKWRRYSFHQYKHANAIKHGAEGMLYIYHIANPNNSYSKDLIYSHIGKTITEDLFSDSKISHEDLLKKIKEELKPQSYETGKRFRIKNTTEHHPSVNGSNIIAYLEGSDPKLKNEYIMVGGHLDHLGKCYTTMPGANDNASAVSVTLGVAKALSKSELRLKRSVVFFFSGAEEAGLGGVQYFLKHPTIDPLDQIVGYINMDGVGIGNKIWVEFAENYPKFYDYLAESNNEKGTREMSGRYTKNIGRPRLDAAFFDWYGIPVLSLYTYHPREAFKNYRYHTPYDNISNINQSVLYDLAEIITRAIIKMANEDELNFNRPEKQVRFIDP